jgi:hypothetical protein
MEFDVATYDSKKDWYLCYNEEGRQKAARLTVGKLGMEFESEEAKRKYIED